MRSLCLVLALLFFLRSVYAYMFPILVTILSIFRGSPYAERRHTYCELPNQRFAFRILYFYGDSEMAANLRYLNVSICKMAQNSTHGACLHVHESESETSLRPIHISSKMLPMFLSHCYTVPCIK